MNDGLEIGKIKINFKMSFNEVFLQTKYISISMLFQLYFNAIFIKFLISLFTSYSNIEINYTNPLTFLIIFQKTCGEKNLKEYFN